jgi:hypothetical protein
VPHVLVHACEVVRLDDQAGFFEHLAHESIVDGFAQLEDAAWRLPPAVVPPSNAKEPIGLDDGRRDAHVVFSHETRSKVHSLKGSDAPPKECTNSASTPGMP